VRRLQRGERERGRGRLALPWGHAITGGPPARHPPFLPTVAGRSPPWSSLAPIGRDRDSDREEAKWLGFARGGRSGWFSSSENGVPPSDLIRRLESQGAERWLGKWAKAPGRRASDRKSTPHRAVCAHGGPWASDGHRPNQLLSVIFLQITFFFVHFFSKFHMVSSIQIILAKICLENSKVTETFLKRLKLMNF
jgi:hypothetical protein